MAAEPTTLLLRARTTRCRRCELPLFRRRAIAEQQTMVMVSWMAAGRCNARRASESMVGHGLEAKHPSRPHQSAGQASALTIALLVAAVDVDLVDTCDHPGAVRDLREQAPVARRQVGPGLADQVELVHLVVGKHRPYERPGVEVLVGVVATAEDVQFAAQRRHRHRRTGRRLAYRGGAIEPCRRERVELEEAAQRREAWRKGQASGRALEIACSHA
eukprot:3938405-Rhodomonas_salina.1